MLFNKDILKIDATAESERICAFIRRHMHTMKRDGAIIGISGGIDSAVSTALCVQALGKDKVLGLILPEKDSNPISALYAKKQVEKLGIKYELIDITKTLEGFGTYEKRDAVVKSIFPEYKSEHRFKITLPADLLNKDALNFFTLKIDIGDGDIKTARLNKEQLNGIVAATCTKQRTRMMHLYYHAEKNNYFVCGTTNRTEATQGLFVKYGDGGVDIEPVAHLYKNQIYQLTEYLGVVKEIIKREPSPDTFSYTVTDEEFYFRIPFDKLDHLLCAWENDIAIAEVSEVMNLTEEQVKRVFRDFTSKFNTTKHLRQLPPTLGN